MVDASALYRSQIYSRTVPHPETIFSHSSHLATSLCMRAGHIKLQFFYLIQAPTIDRRNFEASKFRDHTNILSDVESPHYRSYEIAFVSVPFRSPPSLLHCLSSNIIHNPLLLVPFHQLLSA